jgi:SH3-like domain-containing protein
LKQEPEEAAVPAVPEQAAISPAPPAPPRKPAEAGEYVSIAQIGIGANIHPEPSMSSEVLRAFPPGYPVVVLERRGKWLLIEDFRERKGWVYDSLLDSYSTAIIKVKKGNLRSGPDIAENIIAKLDYGTVLSVVKKRGDWLQVKDSDGFSGWLHRDVVWP